MYIHVMHMDQRKKTCDMHVLLHFNENNRNPSFEKIKTLASSFQTNDSQ